MISLWAAWHIPTNAYRIHTNSFFGILDKSLALVVPIILMIVTDSVIVNGITGQKLSPLVFYPASLIFRKRDAENFRRI